MAVKDVGTQSRAVSKASTPWGGASSGEIGKSTLSPRFYDQRVVPSPLTHTPKTTTAPLARSPAADFLGQKVGGIPVIDYKAFTDSDGQQILAIVEQAMKRTAIQLLEATNATETHFPIKSMYLFDVTPKNETWGKTLGTHTVWLEATIDFTEVRENVFFCLIDMKISARPSQDGPQFKLRNPVPRMQGFFHGYHKKPRSDGKAKIQT